MSDTLREYKHQLELAAAVHQIDNQTWEAETAEQALAWLRCELYLPATVAAFVPVEEGTEVRMPQRAFFRGQAFASWEPNPTLLRLSGEDRRNAMAVTTLAASIVDEEFHTLWRAEATQGWPPLAQHSGYAAAQHYDFETNLLDWSTNPSVAVHFATCSDSSADSPLASVLWLYAGDAADLGLRIVLPPVYIDRLYRQRGVFTELDEAMAEVLQQRCHRIHFPAQPRHPALLTNDGTTTIEADLLPTIPWFKNLKQWSRAHANDQRFQSDPLAATIAFTTEHGHHPALNDLNGLTELFSAGDHACPMQSFIFELAARSTREGNCYDPRVLDILERDGHALLDWMQVNLGVQLTRCY